MAKANKKQLLAQLMEQDPETGREAFLNDWNVSDIRAALEGGQEQEQEQEQDLWVCIRQVKGGWAAVGTDKDTEEEVLLGSWGVPIGESVPADLQGKRGVEYYGKTPKDAAGALRAAATAFRGSRFNVTYSEE